MTATLAQYVANPKVTLNIIQAQQTLGLQQQKALLVGQMAPAVRATGKATFSANPAPNDTLTLGGTAVTFVAAGAVGNQVNIGANLAATLTALQALLAGSSDTNLVLCRYILIGNALWMQNKTGGTAGNAFALVKSSAVITLSGPTLAGGAVAPGSAIAGGLSTGISYTNAAINALFGTGSMISVMGYGFRRVNQVTQLDALPLADLPTAVMATAQIGLTGQATQAGQLNFSVANETDHTYQVQINNGDTPAVILANLLALLAVDINLPFIYATDNTSAIMFVAINGGSHANTWVLKYTGNVPAGLGVTLAAWGGGSGNPSLTTVFTPVALLRYQTIVWPEAYPASTCSAFLDGRKNVDNDVMEGRGFTFHSAALSQAETDALGCNSSEMVIFSNVPTAAADGTWFGPHLPCEPDRLAAVFAAARARRYEDTISISDIVATSAPNDQFGGADKSSLPYFNTPMLGVGLPKKGTGLVQSDQSVAEANGVSIIGQNRLATNVVAGVVVTTWLSDVSGNPDTTWKYLEWRDTHGAIREYLVLNLRKQFQQTRMTVGDVVPNYSMANVPMIQGAILALCQDLQSQALIVSGQAARQVIQANMQVTLSPATRTASIILIVPMVSQLEFLLGTVQFNFSIS